MGSEVMLEYLSFIVVGILAGTVGAMLGLGGGFLVVPFLLIIYHYSPQQAAGTSLVMVFFNAISGTIAYTKQKRIDYRSAWKFALATVPGAIGGSFLSRYLTGKIFGIAFGLLLILVAISILLKNEKREKNKSGGINFIWFKASPRSFVDSMGNQFSYHVNEQLGIIISFFVGLLSSILGIGGGIIHVPAMVYILGFPAHVATATSNMILSVTAFGGSVSHLFLGHVMIMAGFFLGLGALVGAQLGAYISKRTKAGIIMKVLAVVLILTGLRLIFM